MAIYQDHTILWLDNHSDSLDFEMFARREKLLTWFPDQVSELVHLLIQTKFNYLGQPSLIQTILDVPGFVRYDKDQKEHLLTISERIQPPKYLDRNGDFQLVFFLWTKLGGKIVKISCIFHRDGTFECEGKTLMTSVGDFLMHT
jgi:hypothetical protein